VRRLALGLARFHDGLEDGTVLEEPALECARLNLQREIGGLIPLSAYLVLADAHRALDVSVGVTLVALGTFGAIKGRFTGASPFRSAVQTMLIGGLAAAAAFGLARAIS